jgi:TatD DNase family protein
MRLVDTHCHIHSLDYQLDREQVIKDAADDGVDKLICVGTDIEDSKLASKFAENHENVWNSIGIHPHESDRYYLNQEKLSEFKRLVNNSKVIAIGECGLDYYYNHSKKESQLEIFKLQIELALENDLPLIFHIREAFDDFWRIIDTYSIKKAVIHSFTDSQRNLEIALTKGFYIGVNGISTFTKNDTQLKMYKSIPADQLVLETDSPYLTPSPFRGNICQPKHVKVTANFLANLRNDSIENLSNQTTINAQNLFNI